MEDFFDNELGRRILALTKASFKVSDLISDMILREKIKHQILSVYKIFFEKKYPELLKELDVLDGFFFLAGHLNLAKEEHVKSLRNGLLVFKSQIILITHPRPKTVITDFPETEQRPEKTVKSPAKKKNEEFSDRQEKILRYFKESKDILKLADLLALFPDVNEKTVRNDLIFLIQIGKISRQGVGSGSHYQLLEK
ncbi:MAG: hypothetical protein Q7K16_04695 [Candidatus Azambacteria bacterium]|nr:hypothetical protein [Candidatus Azambacteria bacterium]